MPITRKQQILFKIETSEAVNAAPGAGDAVLVYEPAINDDVETNDRTPAGSSLSRAVVPTGRKTRATTFQSDFRGSGDTVAPIDEPEWGKMARAAAYEKITPTTLPITAPSGTGYHLGEIVQKDASNRAIVIGLLTGGAFVGRLEVAGDVIVVPLEGTITATGTLTGESSGHTGTIGTPVDYDGLVYKPTSEKIIAVTCTGGYTTTDPTAGDVVTIKDAVSGVQLGLAQVVTIDGAGVEHELTLLDGAVADTDELHFGAANFATVAGDPTMTKTPSATIAHNLDGRQRDSVGARGDFELAADAGNSLVFSWTFSGDPVAAFDQIAVTTTGLSTIRAPRLFAADGAVCTYALTKALGGSEQVLTLPTKAVSLSSGNTVNPDLDANSAGGSRGSNVSDRDPTVGATVNQALGGFDWEQFRDDSETVHMGVVVGKTPGNVCGYVVTNGQVMEAPTGDGEGVATFELVIKPRRVLEGGDDELVMFQL